MEKLKTDIKITESAKSTRKTGTARKMEASEKTERLRAEAPEKAAETAEQACGLNSEQSSGQNSESVDEARVKLAEDALFECAVGGNTTALIFWLKNCCPNKWRDKPEASDKGGDGVLGELLEFLKGGLWSGSTQKESGKQSSEGSAKKRAVRKS